MYSGIYRKFIVHDTLENFWQTTDPVAYFVHYIANNIIQY
jgi:hypothetical protein